MCIVKNFQLKEFENMDILSEIEIIIFTKELMQR